MVEHSFFQSTTIQQKIIDGKEEGEEKHVTIKNGIGTKTVTQTKNGEIVSNATVPLTKKEIENAQNRVFMRKFWHNCKPGTNCAIQNTTKKNKNRNNNNNNSKKNKNNNNSKKNNNKNNSKKNNNKNNSKKNASNNNTKKRRRH
jgi:hypothetical protein